MGQFQGKRAKEGSVCETESYSSRISSKGDEKESACCGTRSKENKKRGLFAKFINSKPQRTVVTKTALCGSSGPFIESICVGQDLSCSKESLGHTEKGQDEKHCNELPITTMCKKSEESLKKIEDEIRDAKSYVGGKSGRESEKDDIAKDSVELTSRPTSGDRDNEGGDFELLRNEDSSCPKEELGERVDEELRKLETPLNWLKGFVSKETPAIKVSCDVSESNRDHYSGKKDRQDYFCTTIQYLWQLTRYTLDGGNLQKASKELSISKITKTRFSNDHRPSAEEWSSSARRGDEDVTKALGIVIDGTEAVLSYMLGNERDATHLLKALKKQHMTQGVEAAIKGIKASIFACMDAQLPTAVDIVREAVSMAPDYWRWQYLLASFLQLLPDSKDPSRETERRWEMLKAMEAVCQLEPWNARHALSLAHAYRNAAFEVRHKQNLKENYREYAKKAVSAYEAAVECASQSMHTHALAARHLWSLKRLCPEASQKAISIAERSMWVLLDAGEDSDADNGEIGDAELESHAEAALTLGLVWETIGQIEKAECLFRIAATNPSATTNVAYRAELGLIVSSFHRGKARNTKIENKAKVDVLSQLDKLLEKYSEPDLQMQTLCHKGHYLMVIKRDPRPALDLFCKAVNLRPDSSFLKRYYPRFSSNHARPLRISDLIHELACKELALIQVRASKGSPKAVQRANLLNEQIQLAQDMNKSQISEATDKNGQESDDSRNESRNVPPKAEAHPPTSKEWPGEQKEDASLVNCEVGGTIIEQQAEPLTSHKVEATAIEKQAEDDGSKDSDSNGDTAISVVTLKIGDQLIKMFKETTL